MLESLRLKVSKMSLSVKFVVRIIYPIVTYLFFYFILHMNMQVELQTVQMLFIFLWLIIEWQVFFKKPQEEI